MYIPSVHKRGDNVFTVNFWSVLLLYGVCQGIVLAGVLLSRRETRTLANVFLAALVVVVSLNLLSYVVVATDLYRAWPHLIVLFQPLLFMIGPLYFLHTKSVVGGYRPGYSDLLHVGPFALALVFRFPFLMLPAPEKIGAIDAYKALDSVAIPLVYYFYFALHVLQTLVYAVAARRSLSAVGAKTPGRAKQELEVLVPWMRFSHLFLGYWVATLLVLTFLAAAPGFAHEVDYALVLIQSFIVHAAGYVGIAASGRIRSRRVSSSQPDSASSKVLVQRLAALMQERKPYLDPDLTLAALANQVGLSGHVLSHVLNRHLGLSFSDYVNRHRVGEAQKRLVDPSNKHLTVLGIALDSGFSSKASFNRAFKKHTGSTPSQFIRTVTIAL